MNDKKLITSDQKLLQVNPDVSRDEQLDFINTYRNLQAANTDEINRQTHAQGSDLPSFKGGLTDIGGYLATRYQQPQTEARVATLRSAAQQAALNQALKNIQENMQEQYNKAYSDYSNAAAKKNAGDGDTEKKKKKKKNTVKTDTGTGTGAGGTTVSQNTATSEEDLKARPGDTTVSQNTATSEGDLKARPDETMTVKLSDGENYELSSTLRPDFANIYLTSVEQLGMWPDGSPLKLNSTYKWGGDTYIYAQPQNTSFPTVYRISSTGGW